MSSKASGAARYRPWWRVCALFRVHGAGAAHGACAGSNVLRDTLCLCLHHLGIARTT